MKTAATTWIAIALVAGLAAAQTHPNGYAGMTSYATLVYFLKGNTLTSVWIGGGTNYGAVMDPLNTLLLVVNSSGDVIRVDPRSEAVVGTLATGLSNPRDIDVDHNGDHFVTSATTLWKIDALGAVTTVRTGLTGTDGGAAIDIDTGELLVQSSTGANVDPTLLVARDGSALTTLGTGADARYGIAQHIPTGDIYIGSCCGDFSPSDNIYRLPRGSGVASVWLASAQPPVGVYSLKADRSSAAVQQLVLGGFGAGTARGDGGFFLVDIVTKSVTRLNTMTLSHYETEILYRRNVGAVSTGKGQWAVSIGIPEDAGRGYVLGVSASGVRPSIGFPDGRRVNLAIDSLTVVGLTSGLGPFLTGTTGTLTRSGTAVAQLDLSRLGPAINGLLLHFLAVTLDGSAPLGIKTITDPFVLKVEGL
ncbi:MAG: hypothetical protein JXQ29_12200 [Planctomycetes bacterium]|nr:hypothetical protein [Planctomycetota bacterium]